MSNYLQSTEFKRASTNAADSGLKLIFKWVGIGIVAAANFAKEIVRNILGK